MKRFSIAVALSLLAAGLARSHDGKHEPAKEGAAVKVGAERGAGGKEVAVMGELVDMACFMAHEGRGAKHAKCAKACVLGGAPLGIVTADGKVYLLVEDHSSAKAKKPFAQARELVAETATVKGAAYERGGVQAIVVESVSKE